MRKSASALLLTICCLLGFASRSSAGWLFWRHKKNTSTENRIVEPTAPQGIYRSAPYRQLPELPASGLSKNKSTGTIDNAGPEQPGLNGGEPVPSSIEPEVLPPDVPFRPPIPIPDSQPTRLPTSFDNTSSKSPLAWRALAYKISSLADDQPPVTARIYAAHYSDILMSLLAACPRAGFAIEALNTDAGQILVRAAAQASIKYVFTVSEMPAGTTTVRAAQFGGSKDQRSNSIQKVFDFVNANIASKGSP